MGVKSTFGENLKRYRKEKNLPQEKLAEKIDISTMHLSRIERGLTFVSAELIEKISKTLGISPYLLFLDKSEIVLKDYSLDNIDRIVETHITGAMEKIKADIRQANE